MFSDGLKTRNTDQLVDRFCTSTNSELRPYKPCQSKIDNAFVCATKNAVNQRVKEDNGWSMKIRHQLRATTVAHLAASTVLSWCRPRVNAVTAAATSSKNSGKTYAITRWQKVWSLDNQQVTQKPILCIIRRQGKEASPWKIAIRLTHLQGAFFYAIRT